MVSVDPDSDLAERAAIADALARLSSDQRDAIERAYFRGMTHAEIATDLGVPLGTIKGRIAAALRRLFVDLAPGRNA